MGEGRNQILCKLTTVYTHTGVCATKCTAALGKQGQLMHTHVLSQVPKKGIIDLSFQRWYAYLYAPAVVSQAVKKVS